MCNRTSFGPAGRSFWRRADVTGLALPVHQFMQRHTDRVTRLNQALMKQIVDRRLATADLLRNRHLTQSVLLQGQND